ncbi:MAG: uncharacterized protein PWR01_2986 [Clostridiales bacterium]|nr:uncharacterized protein [Clostridiales bacterium]MDN5281913.1 uncharacterized protein [Candidatus Ozemobacter sp.]
MTKDIKSSTPLLIALWGATIFFFCFEIIQLIRPADFRFSELVATFANPIIAATLTFAILLMAHLRNGMAAVQRIIFYGVVGYSFFYLFMSAESIKLSWWFLSISFYSVCLFTIFGLWLYQKRLFKTLTLWFALAGLILLYLYFDRQFYMLFKLHLGLIHIWRWQNTAVEDMGIYWQSVWPQIKDISAFSILSLLIWFSLRRSDKPAFKSMVPVFAIFLQLFCVSIQFNHVIENRPFVEYLLARFDASGIAFPLPKILQPLKTAGLEQSSFKIDPDVFYENSKYSWNNDQRYNLIFLTLESVRAHEIEKNMPLLMNWAGKGIYFKKHFSASNITETAINSVYGSMYPFFLTEQFYKIKPWSFIEFLHKDGYELFKVYCKWSALYNEAFYQNFKMIALPEPTAAEPVVNELPFEWFVKVSDYQLNMLARSSEDVLERLLKTVEAKEKFFAEGYLFNGHFNYFYPEKFAKHQPTLPERFLIHDLNPSPENLLKLQNRYKNALGYMDHCIDNFLKQLHEKSLDQNTFLVIFGDHGQSLGESGFFAHVSGPHLFQFQVPCLILGPGIEPQIYDEISQHPDIIPTLGHMMNFTSSNTFGKNLFKEFRSFSLEQDNSVKNRFIVRRKSFMTIYDITSDHRIRWVLTIGNQFELNSALLSLYQQPGLTNLKKIIAEDFRQIQKECRVQTSPKKKNSAAAISN